MHDKYAYEKIQMALHDTEVERFLACGVAGLSVAVDSLSAIKYAKVTPVYNEEGIICDFTDRKGISRNTATTTTVSDRIAAELLRRVF